MPAALHFQSPADPAVCQSDPGLGLRARPMPEPTWEGMSWSQGSHAISPTTVPNGKEKGMLPPAFDMPGHSSNCGAASHTSPVRLQDGLPAQSGAAKRPWPQIQWSVRDIGQRKGFIGPRRVTEDRIGQSPRDLNVSPTWCTDEVPGKHLRRRAWSAAPQRSEGNRRRDLQRRARGLVAHLPSQVGHRIRCPLEVGRNAPPPMPLPPAR